MVEDHLAFAKLATLGANEVLELLLAALSKYLQIYLKQF